MGAPTGPDLPFPPTPSASTAGRTLKDSTHRWRAEPSRLPDNPPNVLILMCDDAGFSNPECFGGPVHMPTLARLAAGGIGYNRFHTTAICSPTRASLLTGRNHHAVGFGQITEFATDFDGYVGEIPRSAMNRLVSAIEYVPKWKMLAARAASAFPTVTASARCSGLPAPPDATSGMVTASATARVISRS